MLFRSGPRDRPPAQRIDFVLVPSGMRVLRAWVPGDWKHLATLSDHLPVVVDLQPGESLMVHVVSGTAFASCGVYPNVASLAARTRERVPVGASPVVSRRLTAESGVLERLLAGVRLPCDLAPLRVDGDDPRLRQSFVTYGYDGREVALCVADELERMGMDIEPLTYREARAFRDGLELAVTIHLEPSRVIRDRRIAYPGLAADAVVIEFSVL